MNLMIIYLHFVLLFVSIPKVLCFQSLSQINKIYSWNRLHHFHSVKITKINSNNVNNNQIESNNQIKAYFDDLLKGYSSIFSLPWKNSPNTTTSLEISNIISTKIAIIGAGISGLSCAQELYKNGVTDFILLESSDSVGGRVKSDNIDGFVLDRGFQVFIEEYPESKALFDYKSLDLRPFLPGAYVRFKKEFFLVSDPLRRPQDLIASLFSPIGSLFDKFIVGILSISSKFRKVSDIEEDLELDTQSYLENTLNLSSSIIDRFFKPFFQGIFLSSLSKQSSRLFSFVFKMFADGAASLPSQGMGAITKQIADNLPPNNIKLNSNVLAISNQGKKLKVIYDNNLVDIKCENLVVATDPPSFKKLMEEFLKLSDSSIQSDYEIPEARSSTCLYFGFEGLPPIEDPILIINGENNVDNGFKPIINNVCFPSQLSEFYAPQGKSLASITIIGDIKLNDNQLEETVKQQLQEWWGDCVKNWKLLKIYRINYSQPAQTIPYDINGKPVKLNENIYVCGDHRNTATLNGAIKSGRLVAKELLKTLE